MSQGYTPLPILATHNIGTMQLGHRNSLPLLTSTKVNAYQSSYDHGLLVPWEESQLKVLEEQGIFLFLATSTIRKVIVHSYYEQ